MKLKWKFDFSQANTITYLLSLTQRGKLYFSAHMSRCLHYMYEPTYKRVLLRLTTRGNVNLFARHVNP